MVCCTLDIIKAKTNMQVDTFIFPFFCWIFCFYAMIFIPMVIVREIIFTCVIYSVTVYGNDHKK